MTLTLRRLLPVWLASLCFAGPAIAQDPAAFFDRQIAGYWRALQDPSVNSRVQRIWLKLAIATGKSFPVRPAQNFNIGKALPNGLVLLDLGIAGDRSEEVTAFWLAHEYGHQVLGHSLQMLTAMGQFRAMMAGTADEDAADRWAARFVAREGYDLEPIIKFLEDLPGGGPGDAHSPGPVRAANVTSVYRLSRPAARTSRAQGTGSSQRQANTTQPLARIEGDVSLINKFVDAFNDIGQISETFTDSQGQYREITEQDATRLANCRIEAKLRRSTSPRRQPGSSSTTYAIPLEDSVANAVPLGDAWLLQIRNEKLRISYEALEDGQVYSRAREEYASFLMPSAAEARRLRDLFEAASKSCR